MKRWSNVEELRNRREALWRALYLLLGLSGLLTWVALLHVDFSAGPRFVDVHAPASWLNDRAHVALEWGEPNGVGRLAQRLVDAIVFLSFWAAQLGVLWVLFRNKLKTRELMLGVVLAFFLLNFFAPAPRLFSPSAARAVSVASAERLLASERRPRSSTFVIAESVDAQMGRYVQAQLALIRGDRGQAERLVREINPGILGSKNETQYRLQFLQGRDRDLSRTCFVILGCVRESERLERLDMLLWLAGVFSVLTMLVAVAWLILSRRVASIDTLVAKRRRIAHAS